MREIIILNRHSLTRGLERGGLILFQYFHAFRELDGAYLVLLANLLQRVLIDHPPGCMANCTPPAIVASFPNHLAAPAIQVGQITN